MDKNKGCLDDARKEKISFEGQALLAWNFIDDFPRNSVQMPEEVVDQILEWRNQHLSETRK